MLWSYKKLVIPFKVICVTIVTCITPVSLRSHPSLGDAAVTNNPQILVAYNLEFYFLLILPFHCESAENAAPPQHILFTLESACLNAHYLEHCL